MKRAINYIVIGDVHLGNPNNTAREIIENLSSFFDDFKPRTDNLDFIFIEGDLFDRLLDLSRFDIELSPIMAFFERLLSYCNKNDIRLRILEGTPLHDRKQGKIVIDVVYIMRAATDVEFIDKLYIEMNEELGISILYIPDEWHHDTSVTLAQVKDLLKQHNLTQVDLAIMHGQFNYQLPKAAFKAPKHDEGEYLSLVKHFIHIGHVHQFSTYERILAAGSFDRLVHGDEIPKGGLYCTIRPDGNDEFKFIENKGAKTYTTLKVKDSNVDDALNYIENKVSKLRKGSFVRIKAKKDHPILKNFDLLKKKFIDLNFTKFNEEDTDSDRYSLSMQLDENLTTYHPIVIRKETIKDLIFPIIKQKYTLTDAQFNLLDSHLTDVL